MVAVSSSVSSATVSRLFDDVFLHPYLLALIRRKIPRQTLSFLSPFGIPVDQLRVLSRFT